METKETYQKKCEVQVKEWNTLISLLAAKMEKADAGDKRLYAHELLAEIYITQKQYKEAEQALHKAVEVNPTWNIPYQNLANICLVRGDFSSAEKAYQQGLKAIPDDPQLLISMAQMYERNKNYDKAIRDYERVLSRQPGNDIAANNLASLLLTWLVPGTCGRSS